MEWDIFSLMFRRLLAALKIQEQSPPSPSLDRGRAIAGGERFSLNVEGIKIVGSIYFPGARHSRLQPVVVICHGIPGSGTPRPANDPGYEGLAARFANLGFAVVIFNFRGCGESGGDFDMLGWTRDLEAVLEHVSNAPYIDSKRIMVIGFSGGGAAAVYVSAQARLVYGLAVVGTPASFSIFQQEPAKIIDDFRKRGIIRSEGFPKDAEAWVRHFEEIEPRRWAPHFRGQHFLIVHGDADELVPVEQASELYAAAPAGVTRLSIIPGGKHRLRLNERCIEILEAWLKNKVDTRLF
jgi:pimeloyl-ACP methyl ester carboxylesterase